MSSSTIARRKINKIVWNKNVTKLRQHGGIVAPVPQSLKLDSFCNEIEKSMLPVAICFDLDGIYGLNDKGHAEEVIIRKLERIKTVLDHISAPILACIARSQTPRAYVPPELVDHLQKIVLDLIKRRSVPERAKYSQ